MYQLQVPRNNRTENGKVLNNVNIASHTLFFLPLISSYPLRTAAAKAVIQPKIQKSLQQVVVSHLCHPKPSATSLGGRELNNSSDTDQRKRSGSGLNTGGQGLILLCIKSPHCSGCTSNLSLITLCDFCNNDPGAVQNGISINENQPTSLQWKWIIIIISPLINDQSVSQAL